ncbi:hypothetical protein [Candidatus Aquiluna sp. UB-MaderosW2red]|uniref:hypothetical protein n=1 Tax=Candidatus Aquiluna sp. UB-MaderosW2red TaxID=1855377 RepID=UPI000875E526|nr:hypothetical protein [Candidatus Aquiluna sp. UB-MaderosW2red]SCX05985.1 hypothetical protein SAMN05216534_0474 [Candidatus Aquiluna sp. UB-MaderosW2red]
MLKSQIKVFATSALVVSVFLALTGCGAVTDTTSSSAASETVPESSSGTVAPSGADEMGLALLAVEASYELFQNAGMTETVLSGEDKYILSYDPANPVFVAALYNLTFDDAIPVEEKELFTVYAAWLFSQDGSSEVLVTPTGLSISNDVSSPFEVVIEDGLIVSGGALDGSWSGTFSYEPDFEILALIADAG